MSAELADRLRQLAGDDLTPAARAMREAAALLSGWCGTHGDLASASDVQELSSEAYGRKLFLDHAAIAADSGSHRITMSFEQPEHYEAAIRFFDMAD